MESLKIRLEKRLEDYKEICEAEKEIQIFIDKLETSLPKATMAVSVYAKSFHIYINSHKSPMKTEEKDLNLLSSIYDIKWERIVEKDSIYFKGHYTTKEYIFYIQLIPIIEGICIFKAIATGKTKRVMRAMEIEEPEITYLFNCGEENE